MQKVLIYQIEMAHSGKQPLLQAGDMDSDLDKDDNSEIVSGASIRDTSRIIPGQTRDKYYLTYFSFYLLGIVVITPWSFFVTANDYWMYKFRDINTNVSMFMNEKQTSLQVEFTSFLNVAACVPTLLFLILNIYLIKRVSLSARVLTVMIMMFILFILTVIFVNINTDKWQEQFFVLTMVTMIILNGCSAILSGSIFGIVGNFSSIYITAVNSGQSLGGIFAAIAEIISLAIGASSTHAAFVYFMIGSATILFGIIGYILMVNTIFFKYNIRVKPLEGYSDSSSLVKDLDYVMIFRKVWTVGVTCFMVLFTTTCVSPGVTVLVESEGKGQSKWSDIFFVPVINYLLFNVSDYIGRLSAGRCTKPDNLIVLMVLSFSRLIFVPLLLLCNAQPRHHLDVVFPKDYEFIIILGLFAVTNGYLVNAAVIKAPQEISEIEELIEKSGTEVLRFRDEWGYTPAHWAALDGNVEIMRLIVDRGAPFDLPCLGIQGPRPIHWACRKGHTAVVQVLLQAGVAVNAADFKGLTPLMTACMFGRTATAAYLLGMGALNQLVDINGDTAMHWAAYKGHADLIRLLMYSGANLQNSDHFGSTPLHLACLSGNVTCVKLIAEKSNIDLEPLDKNDKTPLMLAQSHRHFDIVQALQSEIKKRKTLFPPISEVWGLLFGKGGHSKAPLCFFLCSVLLWGYPMYFIRCIPITWNILRASHYCFIYWNIVMWVCWIVANRKNPGYLPMNTDSYHRAIKQIPYHDKWKKRNTMINRLCHTCKCLRPLRAKHCRICNRCVSYFDHHCPFIYNCVGLRNRTWFFLFVMSVAINCSFTIYFATYCIAIEGFGVLYILGLVEAFVFSGLGWILTCTSVLHACMNLTTNEMFNYKRYPYLRDRRGRYFNPFSRGPIFNLIEFFFCTPEEYEDDYNFEYI